MKKVFKRICSLSIAVSMLAGLTACSAQKKESVSTETPTETSSTETSTEAEESSRQVAEWSDTAIIYEVNVRQYSNEGTFAAFEGELERLKEMGVNTLWFMPIYSISEENRKGTLGSYYAIQDYKSVNSEFGNMEDFTALVSKAHDMGFKVILDWVANHTGWDHTWITEHPEYYLKDAEGNIISPIGQDWDDVAQLDFNNTDMKAAMIDAMKYWITEADIDGFRCDYAQGVPVEFWNEAREELNKIKDIYMLAEEGSQSNSYLISAFDSNYAFQTYDTLMGIAKGSEDAKDLEYKITTRLPEGSFAMNFIENHDKNSYDGSLEERFGANSIPALTTLIFTLKGAPLIYSGQEEGITQTLAFFDKDPIKFETYAYAPLITKLCEIKLSNPVLNNRTGAPVEYISCTNKNILMFKRASEDSQITVVINMSDEKQTLEFDEGTISGDILINGYGSEYIPEDVTSVDITSGHILEPWEYYVIKSN